MSELAQTSQLNTSSDSVTSISVNARIDYILRFSKQAILVVDESAQECSSVGYQFLDQLPPKHNAAFVTASAKLNNIQIRCRIIEQLFSGSVFDPEQSLAVSIVNLLNANPQKLAIVIDNIQFASLQIIHELTQLALIAKKAQLNIDLLMLGDYAAGKKLAEHKDLFHKKISILSKQSGQLLSLNAKEFKTPQSWLTLTISKKWLIAIASISLLAILTVVWLQQQDIFRFSKLPEIIGNKNIVDKKMAESKADQTVLLIGAEQDKTDKIASSGHIYNVLLGNVSVKKETINEAAKVSDIVSAIAAFEKPSLKTRNLRNVIRQNNNEITPPLSSNLNSNRNSIQTSVDNSNETSINTNVDTEVEDNARVVKTVNKEVDSASVADKANNTLVIKPVLQTASVSGDSALETATKMVINNPVGNDYYQSFTRGFVIQVAGFTQHSIMEEFLADFTSIEFKQYQRWLNNEIMTVLTSKHYATRAQAEQALSNLPDTILVRGPWIKSISAINNEINAFERSQ